MVQWYRVKNTLNKSQYIRATIIFSSHVKLQVVFPRTCLNEPFEPFGLNMLEYMIPNKFRLEVTLGKALRCLWDNMIMVIVV